MSEPTFREVYEEHFRFVWRSLRRLGVPESDVADAVQDVFLVVHRRLGDFEGRSKVSTWLYGISLRVARDRKRSAFVRRNASDDEPIEDRVDHGGRPRHTTSSRPKSRKLQGLRAKARQPSRRAWPRSRRRGGRLDIAMGIAGP